jgi:hypothetical protein
MISRYMEMWARLDRLQAEKKEGGTEEEALITEMTNLWHQATPVQKAEINRRFHAELALRDQGI